MEQGRWKFIRGIYHLFQVRKNEGGDENMVGNSKDNQEIPDDSMKITIRKNGPYVVTGGIPLIEAEICTDEEGYSRTWREVKRYPVKEEYALCRCGNSKNKPFCDGTHAHVPFEGFEIAGDEYYLLHPAITKGPDLELLDYKGLCVHARFCKRAGGVWNLTKHSDNPDAKDTAIEEACNCPSGKLIVRNPGSGEIIDQNLEKSIVIVENPAKGEHGPLWVRGRIPVISAHGISYTIRNRVTLCRCGKSNNIPFCDGSHVYESKDAEWYI